MVWNWTNQIACENLGTVVLVEGRPRMSPERHPSVHASLNGLVVFAMFLLGASAQAAAPGKDGQKCLNALAREGQKVARVAAVEIEKCVLDVGKGKAPDPLLCAEADARGRLVRAWARTAASEDKFCAAERPGFGLVGHPLLAEAATRWPRALAGDLLGSSSGFAIGGIAEAQCQRAVLASAGKIGGRMVQGFAKCLKSELKAGALEQGPELEAACAAVGAGGSGSRVLKEVAKLGKIIGKKCNDADLEILFPGRCAESADFPACVKEAAACRVCRYLNDAHGLATGCDFFDDGLANQSCPPCDSGLPENAQDAACAVPTLSVVAVDAKLHEGGLAPGRLRISLSVARSSDTQIDFILAGSAELGVDYLLRLEGGEPVASPLWIAAGEQSVDIVVVPVATPALEVAESIVFSPEPSADFELDGGPAILSVVEYGPSTGAVYFVADDGDDANGGDEAAPFATIGYAVQQLAAGDTLLIKDGVYTNNGYAQTHGVDGDVGLDNGLIARLTAAGTPENWITIAAYPDGNDTRPVLKFDGAGGIQINSGANYIRIEGLEIQGPNREIQYDWAHAHRWSKENFYTGRGIYSWGPVHHIVVENCDVHHTPGSGIRFNKADYILVQGNTVSNTTWWSSSAESAIVIAVAEHVDTEDVVKFLYSGNVVYNNWNFMEFCSSPLKDSVEDVYGNCDHYTGGIIDGQGLYVTRNNASYAYGRMRFENNIAFNNGFGGVVYHKTDRGELVNNLVFQNGAYPGLSKYTGMTVNTADDLLIANNIIWARSDGDYGLKNNGNASNVVTTHNYVVGRSQFGSEEDNQFIAFTQAEPFDSLFAQVVDISVSDPDPDAVSGDFSPAGIDAWVQGYALDFHLREGALELVDMGDALRAPTVDFDGMARPQGGGVDIGPFELD
jgi:parallel beta-helix repeat protein